MIVEQMVPESTNRIKSHTEKGYANGYIAADAQKPKHPLQFSTSSMNQ